MPDRALASMLAVHLAHSIAAAAMGLIDRVDKRRLPSGSSVYVIGFRCSSPAVRERAADDAMTG